MNRTTKNTLVFPALEIHMLDAGGDETVEIKHVHPQHASQEERSDRLKEKYHTCLALISTSSKAVAHHSERSA